MIAIIAILASLLLPALVQAKTRAKRVQCISNLRQVGLGFLAFSHDHNGKFPMQVPAAAGGAQEFAQSAYRASGEFFFAYQFFQPLSNELTTARILVCPADTRVAEPRYAGLTNGNLSYFVGINANPALPTSLLSGDRNLTNDYTGPASLVRLGPQHFLRWTHELHHFKGNLLFADGHVDEVNSLTLVAGGDPRQVADLVIPSDKSPVSVASGPAPGGGTPGGNPGGDPTGGKPAPIATGTGPAGTTAVAGGPAPKSDPGKKPESVTQRSQASISAGGRSWALNESALLITNSRQTNALPLTNLPLIVKAESNVPAVDWPVATEAHKHPFSSWPFWVILLILLATIIFFESHRRLEARRKRLEQSHMWQDTGATD